VLVRHIDGFRRIYISVRERYPFETVAICVLPDHLQAHWALSEGHADLSLRWSLIKSGFSRGLLGDMPRSSSKMARREREIWQRRYSEHAIRDDADLERHVDVSQICDWPHSSFHRFVARGVLPVDWGGDVREMTGTFGE